MFKPDIEVIFKSNIEVATFIHSHPTFTPSVHICLNIPHTRKEEIGDSN